MTCEVRLQMGNGFPYTCGLPAQACTLIGELASAQVRLCADCRQTFREQGYVVVPIVQNNKPTPITNLEEREQWQTQ